MARILLGVTGGIAAYKACTLVRLLVRAGHDVYPLVTPAAERFVAAETYFALARKSRSDDPYPHLERSDLLVVAPLTANTLARLAHGLADDLLTEAALAHDGLVLVAPAMNVRMWRHRASQANVEILRERGVEIVGPSEGELAEGDVGMGRMAEPDEIADCVAALLRPRNSLLQGKTVLVSAGGTREPLDSVRFVGNRSSGRVGIALTEKRPKDTATWTIELEPTSDVLAALGAARRPGQVLVGFAADGAAPGLERARAKRAAKGADLFVFNDVSRSDIGFDAP